MVAWMKIVKSEAPGQFFVVGMDVAKDQRLNLTELFGYCRACEPYLTNDMRNAINNEDVKGFGALVSRLTASNPDGTVARRDPGWEDLFDFEIKFGEYLEMKKQEYEDRRYT